MADYRTTKVYRERRENDSDDERFKSTTVTRYKVNQPRVERYDRVEKFVEMDDERRSRYSGPGERDFVEYERRERAYVPDRPRSAVDVEADRSRTVFYERDVERRETDRDWERERRPRHHEEDVRVEKRVEERFDDGHGHEVDRYRKETEYYREPDHTSSPVVVRQRAPDQKIIVQEAPPQQIVIPRQDPSIIVLREREGDREVARPAPYDEEYYYRRERREIGPYKGDRRPRRDDYHSDEDDYYYSRRTTRRERSQSSDHHKRHLAEGALAGAGITALLSSRPNEYGEISEHRGKKVLAGAALGAIGTEAIRRAHSAYEEHWGDGNESPDRHSTLKKGLGIAAVALAAAGAVKYHQASKAEKEERRRGRSRNRGYYSSDEDYYSDRSHSRKPSRKRSLSTLAKAAIGTAATAGIVKHFRDKSKSRSKSRHSRHGSRSRSKSALRRGAELAAGAAAVGVAGKMWKDHHDKKKERERGESASRGYSDEDREYDGHNSHSLIEYGHDPLPPDPRSPTGQGYESEAEERRRNRRRRRERDPSSSSESDEERKRSRSQLRDMAAAGAAAAGIKEYKDRKERERREEERREEKREERKEDRKERRSKERRSREREEQGQRYPKVPSNGAYFEDQNRPHSPPNASGGAYYGAPPYPTTPGSSIPGNVPPPPAPPPAAGPPPPPANVPPREHSYTPYTDPTVPEPREYHPYVPQDYHGYAPPPPPAGPPPPSGPPPPGNSSGVPGYARPPAGPPPSGPAPPPGPPPPGPPAGGSFPQDYVSDLSRNKNPPEQKGGPSEEAIKPLKQLPPPRIEIPPPGFPLGRRKSVSFGPLSPTSTITMKRHKKEHELRSESDSSESEGRSSDTRRENQFNRSNRHRRQSSDTTHDRSPNRGHEGRHRRHHYSDSDDEVENLPDRFDSHGRPLDGGRHGRSRLTTRSGEFHRLADRPGGLSIHGGWQLAGTDPEQIQKIVSGVTGALQGRRSWVSVVGDVLGGDLLGQLGPLAGALQAAGGSGGGGDGEGGRRGGGGGDDDDEDGDRRHKRRR
ncbi:hypothetical protein M441DRAFT_80518 [Trichoderma asperellum CBS 433.97]|uniref:DUF3824 domain-containing protein n=1 Tax=Trichoderma asperellum (strain ATCC 204424 / CBS 433.97 / NBRC 101777) TaxID=1042311 RepID=A0A2T3Z8G4_TRIA4|nr:hypothetical protein M441DRAFT_80518 [Trichoderma asperellum CBS 433.97]PTB41101.1 hypothetical protein M441DRAFT_80518 [Trichoderma asperellum CBS 433.97]